jgi:replication factor C subunit 1
MNNLWVNKYKPNNLDEIFGNKNQIKRIKEWLSNTNNSKSMSLIISGNHGIGKTISMKYVLESCDYNVKMILPDEIKHYRNNEDFKDFYNYENSIKNKMKFSNKKFSNKLAMIFDETESITLTSEKKFITEIFKINNKKKMFPLIFICNNQHSKLLNDLKKNCEEIKFLPPSNIEIKSLISLISNNEGIIFKNDIVIDKLIDFSQKDIRKLINLLQELNFHYNKIEIDLEKFEKFIQLSKEKHNELGLFETTLELINKNMTYDEINQLYENDKVLLPLMIHENFPKRVLSKSTLESDKLIDRIYEISNSISIGDIVETSIYTDQNWFLQKIHCFFSCVYTNYWINNCESNDVKLLDIKFSSDLNKTSLKNINKKNICNLTKFLPNKSLQDILHLNRISNYLMANGEEELLVNILKSYNQSFNIKELELCLKIDKTSDFIKLNSKEKKNINKIIGESIDITS